MKQRIAMTRDDKIAALGRTLSSDPHELLTLARRLALDYDRAIMTSAAALFEETSAMLDAVVWRLNGETMFGCGVEGAARDQVADALRAKAGEVPHWGQPGEFLVETDDVRVRVEYQPAFTYIGAHFAFRWVDADRPFISPTGYQSHFLGGPFTPFRVDELARSVVNDCSILHVVRCASEDTVPCIPAWVPPSKQPGQIGFIF